jgi:hypothetical protein
MRDEAAVCPEAEKILRIAAAHTAAPKVEGFKQIRMRKFRQLAYHLKRRFL